MAAVEAALRSHPARLTHLDALSRCIETCFTCAGTCTACADACLSERDVEGLLNCIRQNLDCAAICVATGSVVARSKAGASRQILESQLSVCGAAAAPAATNAAGMARCIGTAGRARRPATIAPRRASTCWRRCAPWCERRA